MRLRKILQILVWAGSILDLLAITACAEPMSTAMALLYGSGIAAGGGILGGLLNKASQQQTGYDIYKPDTFPGYEQLGGTNVAFLQSELERLKRGEYPGYLQAMIPAIRRQKEKPLYERYFGIPGQRTGMIQAGMEAGAQMGTGKKAGTAQVNKQLYNFNSESAQIDDYITQMLGGYTQQAAMSLPNMVASAPSGNPYQVISYGGGASGGGGGMGTSMANAGSALGQGLFNYAALGGSFGTPKPSTPASTIPQGKDLYSYTPPTTPGGGYSYSYM